MKFQSSSVRNSLLILGLILALTGVRAAAQSQPSTTASSQAVQVPARITQAIDESQMVTLRGNVHPLARATFDQGPVANATPMKRMMLLLQRSPEQEAALRQFMDEQMSKESPNFHNWLTPEQFGQLYGPAAADIQTVTDWLVSQGFSGIRVNRGKTVIEFSGNVGQVRSAFRTEIHKFMVEGQERQANTSDPQIPAALTPVVAGIVSLHNFPVKSMRKLVGQFSRTADGRIQPEFTSSSQSFFAVGPADFAKIYNIPAALDGTGGKIAIIGFSSIDLQDTRDFRTLFSLPANDPVIVNNGPDPGIGSEEGEADLDVQWSGAVAPKATIHYVLSEQTLTSSDPIFLGAEYVIDNNSDDVMSLSFGACEAGMGSTTNNLLNALWQQAAAQGITVTVSSGDNGTAGCDDFNSQSKATGGIAVSGIASTAFNIAVGGTDFDDVGTQISGGFWNAANGPGKLSANGYIHEVPWNDSCAATATPANLTTCATADNIVAASGGPSILYAKPSFQSGITPNGIAAGDNHRYLPDVSLFASDGPASKSFYVVCQADAVANPSTSCAATGSFSFLGVGGTSASAPSFAGIIALIGQSEFTAGRSRRQGNANFVLYKIAATAGQTCNSSTTGLTGATCSFYDVTKGNNSVPCTAGSTNCSSTTGANGVLVTVNGTTKTPAFTSATGYDLATGLGTVNVTNLAAAWGTAVGAFKPTTTATKINGGTATVTITHGQSVSLAATVTTTATGTPSGDVSFLAPTAVNGGIGSGTLSGGTATVASTFLPGGSYNVKAHYAGDGIFSASDDLAGVPVVVTPESSRMQMEIVTFDNFGNILSTNATTMVYGSPYILRMDVLNSKGTACTPLVTPPVLTGCASDATGTITLKDNGALLDGGTFILNIKGHAEDQPIQLPAGAHTLTAIYNGDISYNASPLVTNNATVTKAATATGLTADQTTATTAQTVNLIATISTQSSGVGPTGTVTFSTCGIPPCTATLVPVAANPTTRAPATATATLPTVFTTTGTKTITATYGGDSNYNGSGPSTAVTVMITSGNPVPTITTISPTSATAGGPAFTLTINGTNFVSSASKVTFGTNSGLVPTSVTATQITVSIPASAIATSGTPVVFVTNASPGGGPSNSVNFTVNSSGSFTVSLSPNPMTIATTPSASGTMATGTSTITVHPAGGFAGTVTVNCPTTDNLPPGMLCAPVTIPSGSTTGTLSIKLNQPSATLSAMATPTADNLRAANMSMSREGGGGWWTLSAGTGLASMFLLFLPGRKRYRAALGLGLVCVLSFTLGCSSVGSGGGGVTPVATTTTVSVASIKVTNGTNITFTIAVNGSVGANGQVQLLDGSNPIGTPVTVSNGAATIMNAGLAVGTHSINAHYLGDSRTLASTSGVLNVTVTGMTPALTITATSGSISATTTMTVTIN